MSEEIDKKFEKRQAKEAAYKKEMAAKADLLQEFMEKFHCTPDENAALASAALNRMCAPEFCVRIILYYPVVHRE